MLLRLLHALNPRYAVTMLLLLLLLDGPSTVVAVGRRRDGYYCTHVAPAGGRHRQTFASVDSLDAYVSATIATTITARTIYSTAAAAASVD